MSGLCFFQLTDFGISEWRQTQTTATRMSQAGTSRGRGGAGTVTHVAPERWGDINHKATQAYDMYAMGVLMWEIFTEKVPFGSKLSLWTNVIMSDVK